MSLYADLDISLIKGLPKEEKLFEQPFAQKKREDVYRFIEQEIIDGGQVYIIFPLIEESEARFKRCNCWFEKNTTLSSVQCLLHGRVSSEKKKP